jgi:hypothetical protein
MQISLGAFISMTVFFRTKLRQKTIGDGTEYLGALFYAIASIMFNGFGDLAILISRLPVIIKQRDLLFYPAWSYSLATIVLNIPITLVQSVVWVSMTYYVTGYAPEASRFFKQMLLLFLVGQMSGSMFRMIGALCRTTVLANTIGFLAILICFMLGGFVIPKPNIKKWWIWGYWISPLTYAQQAIGVNEMLAPRWQTVVALSKLPQNPHLKHKPLCCFIIVRSHVEDPCRLMCCCHHCIVQLSAVTESNFFVSNQHGLTICCGCNCSFLLATVPSPWECKFWRVEGSLVMPIGIGLVLAHWWVSSSSSTSASLLPLLSCQVSCCTLNPPSDPILMMILLDFRVRKIKPWKYATVGDIQMYRKKSK